MVDSIRVIKGIIRVSFASENIIIKVIIDLIRYALP
jgi:hypothetical protein